MKQESKRAPFPWNVPLYLLHLAVLTLHTGSLESLVFRDEQQEELSGLGRTPFFVGDVFFS